MRPRCPSCGHDLYRGETGGVSLHQCEACRGVWFRAGQMKKAAGQPLPALGIMRRSERRCPACNTKMDTAPFGSVEVEWCGACEGLFLDAGEMERVRAGVSEIVHMDPVDRMFWLFLLAT